MTIALETGLEALSRHFAGRLVRVPRDPMKLMQKLPSELDEASAVAVCEAVGGSLFYARKATRALAEARNSLIRVRRSHGATLNDLAEEFCISVRQISNILKDQ